MLADLEKLRARLVKGRGASKSFSLVLVGPGLWSHFYSSGKSILARYHVTGPIDKKSVVLTHHSVVKSLLAGSLTVNQALKLGLITYTGQDSELIKQAFESGFG